MLFLEGYGFLRRQNSRKALIYLHWLKQTQFPNLRTAFHASGEKKIDGMLVDGFDEDSNTVFEIQGCFYHR